MRRDFDAELGMFKAVADFVRPYVGYLYPPIISTYHGLLTSLISGIQGGMEISTLGITETKEQARFVFSDSAMNIVKMLLNFASDRARPDTFKPPSVDNPPDSAMVQLKAEMKLITDSFLNKLKDEELISWLYKIDNKAAELLAIPQ